jgi:polygalacturonase
MSDHPTTYAVTEYGDTDGTATTAFQSAVDACHDAGGGTVLVPPGEYETGTVHLKSHVTLRLEAGATVYASPDESDYDDGRIGPDGERVFLLAEDAEDIALTGRGEFHGRGEEIMRMDTPIQGHSGESSAHPLITSGPHDARQGEDYLDRADGTDDWPVAKPDFRPGPMFTFERCEDVRISGLTLRDMPSWTIHLDGSREVDISGVDIVGHKQIPNNDGIAITDSQNVHVSDCTVITCDDSIVLNGTDEYEQDCGSVTVTNCTLESNACAIKFGSGTDCPMSDFAFQNILIRDSNRGLGIQHRDSGTLENVLFSDIVVHTRLLSGPWWGKAEPIYVTSVPRDDDTDLGEVRNVRFSNVTATAENGALIYGSDEATLENVTLDGVDLAVSGSENSPLTGGNFDLQPTSAETPIGARDISGVHAEGVDGLSLDDVTVEWDDNGSGSAADAGGDGLPDYYANGLRCVDVTDADIEGFEGRQAHVDGEDTVIALRDVETISITESRANHGTGRFLDAEGTADARRFGENDLAAAESVGDADDVGFLTTGNLLPR